MIAVFRQPWWVYIVVAVFTFWSGFHEADSSAARNSQIEAAVAAGPPAVVPIEAAVPRAPDDLVAERRLRVRLMPGWHADRPTESGAAIAPTFAILFASDAAPDDRVAYGIVQVGPRESFADFVALVVASPASADGTSDVVLHGREVEADAATRAALTDLGLTAAPNFIAMRPFVEGRVAGLKALRRDPDQGTGAGRHVALLIGLYGLLRLVFTSRWLMGRQVGEAELVARAASRRPQGAADLAPVSHGPSPALLSSRSFDDGDTPIDRIRRRAVAAAASSSVGERAGRGGGAAGHSGEGAEHASPITRIPTLGERLQAWCQRIVLRPKAVLTVIWLVAGLAYGLYHLGLLDPLLGRIDLTPAEAEPMVSLPIDPGQTTQGPPRTPTSVLVAFVLTGAWGLLRLGLAIRRRSAAQRRESPWLVQEAEVDRVFRAIPLHRRITLTQLVLGLVATYVGLHLLGVALDRMALPDIEARRQIMAFLPLLSVLGIVWHMWRRATGAIISRESVRARLTDSHLRHAIHARASMLHPAPAAGRVSVWGRPSSGPPPMPPAARNGRPRRAEDQLAGPWRA